MIGNKIQMRYTGRRSLKKLRLHWPLNINIARKTNVTSKEKRNLCRL